MMAGRLSERIVFEARTLTDLANGGIQTSWGRGVTLWGEANRSSETTARFIVRYRSGITPASHRIVWDGARWEITSAIHNRKRTVLTIDCDFSALIDVTHLQSTEHEYIEGLAVVRPTE